MSPSEFRWRFGNAGPSDISQWRTAPPPQPSSPSQVAGYCCVRLPPLSPLKQPFEALQTQHLLLPLPHSAVSSARDRHLGWQELLRAKKHLVRAGWMSGGRAVMSPLNVRLGARNIKCRPYRPALASHNPNRGHRVKAIHNSNARPPRSPQVVQHGGLFRAAWLHHLWLHEEKFVGAKTWSSFLRGKRLCSRDVTTFCSIPFLSWCKTLRWGDFI